MTEANKKAFDFAADLIKLLITLATGIISLSVTFLKDILGTSPIGNHGLMIWLYITWGVFFLSIICGIGAYMSLTGNLGKDSITNKSIYTGNIQKLTGACILFFLLGIIGSVFIVSKSRNNEPKQKTVKTELYFGLAKPDGTNVNDSLWLRFSNEELSKTFKNGMTIIKSSVKWFDINSQKIVTEDSYCVSSTNNMTDTLSAKIDFMRIYYCKLFNQSSVLRVDQIVKADF